MIQKYWPYLLIIFSILFFIIFWPLSKDRNIVLPSKIKQEIIIPTPTLTPNENSQLLDKNAL